MFTTLQLKKKRKGRLGQIYTLRSFKTVNKKHGKSDKDHSLVYKTYITSYVTVTLDIPNLKGF